MGALRTKNIALRIGQSLILDGVSLDLAAKGAVAIIGPNGAGKSSLLRIMAGVASPSDGEFLLTNTSLKDMRGAQRAKTIGYVPQHFVPHWDLSAEDLVRLGLERIEPANSAAVAAVMQRFNVQGFAKQKWSTLSGGERARVVMAMVLGTDPPILLADETGASLDIQHRLSLVKMFAARGEKNLSVVVMHDLDLAFRFFDRIILMAGGRIIADAKPDDLFGNALLDQTFGICFERVIVNGNKVLFPA